MMLKRHRGHRRRIGVPKGMLRHLTLKFMEKRPMSGSEIMEKIEEFTDWRPSPGSIYPLLAHLQEDGVIELHEDEDPSLKRFSLTESGLQMMDVWWQKKIGHSIFSPGKNGMLSMCDLNCFQPNGTSPLDRRVMHTLTCVFQNRCGQIMEAS